LPSSAGSSSVTISQVTGYPWNGTVELSIQGDAAPFSLALRIPSWCPSFTCSVNGRPAEVGEVRNGFLSIRRAWSGADRVVLELSMPVLFIQADPEVRELAGKLAIQRGPLVYCVESCDNGPGLHMLTLDTGAEATAEYRPDLMGGTCVIHARGHRDAAWATRGREQRLYQTADPSRSGKPVRVIAIPYHQWGNREPNGEMSVWLRAR
jgi:uncharacterized protein